jgi:hypothetical protein
LISGVDFVRINAVSAKFNESGKLMKSISVFIFLLLTAFSCVFAQEKPQTENLSAKNNYFVSLKQADEKPASFTPSKRSQPAQTQTPTYTRPTAEKRFKRYVNDTIGPFTLLGIAASAGISTATNEPEEWGKKAEGFGRRVASNFGRTLIRETAIYGLDEALKLDSGFYRSQKRDVGSRVKNALLSTVTARKANGKRTIGVPRLVGTYTASIVAAETWFPARYTYKDGLQSGTISLGINAAFNLFREFIFKK